MPEWLLPLTAAHWAVLGLGLLVLETLLPGAFLLWFGLGALVTSLLAWLLPLDSWHVQCVVFAIASTISVLGVREWRRRRPPASTDQPLLNNRVAALVGRICTLDEAVTNGRGRVQIGDAYWSLSGPDLAAGQRIRIVGAEGLTLLFIPVDPA